MPPNQVCAAVGVLAWCIVMFPPTGVTPFCRGRGTKQNLSLNWPGEVAKVPGVRSTRRPGTGAPLLSQPQDTSVCHLPTGSPRLGGSEHPQKLLSVSSEPSVSEGPRPGPGLITKTTSLPCVDLWPSLSQFVQPLSDRSLQDPLGLSAACPLYPGLLDPPCPRDEHQPNRACPTVQAPASQIFARAPCRMPRAHHFELRIKARHLQVPADLRSCGGRTQPPAESAKQAMGCRCPLAPLSNADQARHMRPRGSPPMRSRALRLEPQKLCCVLLTYSGHCPVMVGSANLHRHPRIGERFSRDGGS
ncbi:hypothetical protein NDU88_008831 [Pleurodeles waltl]|uniref:Uncharacterized protein n=1 Tax=Pleurodeles waltl TaxID=8319 RepID=A0AAV7RUF3_PLEWA|nr:hypothetical protein NDU88_008831 [Pleurodeles waltl]